MDRALRVWWSDMNNSNDRDIKQKFKAAGATIPTDNLNTDEEKEAVYKAAAKAANADQRKMVNQANLNTDIDEKLDDILTFFYLNSADLMGTTLDAVKAEAANDIKQLIQKSNTEYAIKELEDILSGAREHTITDIEMIMHHTQGKVDFIEAVKTDIIQRRISALKSKLGVSDE